MRRAAAARILVTAGAAGVLVTSFATWLDSGQEGRSTYELLGVARRLDVIKRAWVRGVLNMWPLMPLLIVGAVVAAWYGRAAIARTCGVACGALTIGLSIGMLRARIPRIAGTLEPAMPWTMIATSVVVLGGVALLPRRSDRAG